MPITINPTSSCFMLYFILLKHLCLECGQHFVHGSISGNLSTAQAYLAPGNHSLLRLSKQARGLVEMVGNWQDSERQSWDKTQQARIMFVGA